MRNSRNSENSVNFWNSWNSGILENLGILNSRVLCDSEFYQSTEHVQPLSTLLGLTVKTSADGVSVGATASALVGNVQTPALTLAVEDQKALRVTTAVTTVAFTTQTVVLNGGNIVHIHHHTAPSTASAPRWPLLVSLCPYQEVRLKVY